MILYQLASHVHASCGSLVVRLGDAWEMLSGVKLRRQINHVPFYLKHEIIVSVSVSFV